MKKFLAFATLASVALVGCVNDEKMEMTSGAQKISFDTPVMSTQTRADVKGEINTAIYPDEDFVVFAMQSSTELTTATWTSGTNFWGSSHENGLVVTKKNDSDWQHSTDVYYWPKDGFLSFAAYSPAVLDTDGGTVAYGNNGWTVTGFKVNPTVGSHIDLMCAAPVFNQTEPTGSNDGVDITFAHTLSSIVFSAIDQDAQFDYTINSITVSGAIAMTGNMSESDNKYVWGFENKPSTTLSKTGLSHGVNASQVTEFLTGTNALLLIPQTEVGDVEVTLNLTRKTAGDTDNPETTYNKTVKLSEFVVNGGTNNNTWEAGKRYIYNFTIGGTKPIFFTPAVTEWTPVKLNVAI